MNNEQLEGEGGVEKTEEEEAVEAEEISPEEAAVAEAGQILGELMQSYDWSLSAAKAKLTSRWTESWCPVMPLQGRLEQLCRGASEINDIAREADMTAQELLRKVSLDDVQVATAA